MATPVDFKDVSTAGVEASDHPEALAGLRANEARYFHTKYGHVFRVCPAEEAADALVWVEEILREERGIAITSPALQVSVNDVDGIHWVHVFYASGLAVNVLWTAWPTAASTPSGSSSATAWTCPRSWRPSSSPGRSRSWPGRSAAPTS